MTRLHVHETFGGPGAEALPGLHHLHQVLPHRGHPGPRPQGHHSARPVHRLRKLYPHLSPQAIKSVGDSLDILKQYQYCVALPEPALYGQFQHLDSVDIVLNGC